MLQTKKRLLARFSVRRHKYVCSQGLPKWLWRCRITLFNYNMGNNVIQEKICPCHFPTDLFSIVKVLLWRLKSMPRMHQTNRCVLTCLLQLFGSIVLCFHLITFNVPFMRNLLCNFGVRTFDFSIQNCTSDMGDFAAAGTVHWKFSNLEAPIFPFIRLPGFCNRYKDHMKVGSFWKDRPHATLAHISSNQNISHSACKRRCQSSGNLVCYVATGIYAEGHP